MDAAMEDMEVLAILPEIILLAGLVVCLVTGLFVPRRRQWLIALGAGATLLLAIAATIAVAPSPAPVFGATIAADAAHDFARVVILAGALAILALAAGDVRGHAREAEFYVLILFSTLGATILAGATDLMLVVVAYLLSSAPLYTLGAFRKDAAGTEAAMKLFLMAALAGVAMLMGFAYLYGAGGATAYGEIAAAGLDPGLRSILIAATVLALAGYAFKLGAVPAHFWVPDVAAAAPISIAAYVTTIPKIAALLALARLVSLLPEAIVGWPLAVAALAAASMTLGNLAAFWQESPRRLLAYSSIAQIGYILMAVAVLERSALAMPGLLAYAAAYAAMNIGAFAVVAALPNARKIDDYAGLGFRHPLLAGALVVCVLSLIGIPPLGGFLGKLVVFAAAWQGGLVWLVVLGALNTVVSVFYYFRWIVQTIRPGPDGEADEERIVAPLPAAIAVLAAGASLTIGLAGQWVIAAGGAAIIP